MKLGDLNTFSGRLLPGERVLWTGRPGQGLMLTARDTFLIPFSLAWCGFAIFWEWSVFTSSNAPGFFLLWGAMFVVVGLYFVFGRFVVDALVRRGTHYAVTDQRVLIERSSPFEKFIAVSRAHLPEISLDERSHGKGTIRFGQQTSAWGRQGMGEWSPALSSSPQFLMIDDVRRVFNLVQSNGSRP